jgi:UDP-N-acetylmuramoyl-tripeptide--D-alanyl-D-alanine ligase
MRTMTLSELCAPLGAQLAGAEREIRGVSTDSRKLQPGDLFVALAGDNFDGHDYLPLAQRAGAAAALVSRAVQTELPLLRVADTRRALGLLGAYNRSFFEGPLVAITGSSGKTTVKNMAQAVLSRRGRTLATRGNLNNEIGVPLTLLELAPECEFAVVEMGAARAGDIAWLCELGRPTVALLLNAMPAHLQGFGSVGAVAAAKAEILEGLGPQGVAVINADQPWAEQWRARAGAATVLDFALQRPAAIRADAIRCHGLEGVSFIATTPAGDMPIALALPGAHNVANALAAIAAGLACKLTLAEIREGLEAVRPAPGRLSVRRSGGGAMVVDDCYNANPGSVRAAIDLLAACSGRRTLLLGAMRELGEDSIALHRETGEYARAAGIEQLWGVGPELSGAVEAFGSGGRHFADRDAAAAALHGQFGRDDTVLVKGSRGAAMERVLAALLAAEGEVGD